VNVQISEKFHLEGHKNGQKIAAFSSVVGILLGLIAVGATSSWKFSASSLIHLSNSDALAPLAHQFDPNFVFVNSVSHYDGVYYYAMAIDPLIRGNVHTLIDLAAYRYGHPLHSWLAYIISFGQAKFVPLALLVLSLAGLGLIGWFTSKLSLFFGYSPWLGVLVVSLPGFLFVTANSTTETFGAGFILMFAYLLLMKSTKIWLIALCSIILCLDKEQYVLIVLAAFLWLVKSRSTINAIHSRARKLLFAFISGPVALALWYLYVHSRLGVLPTHYESGNITWPFAGWIRTLSLGSTLQTGSFEQSQIGSITGSILCFYFALSAVALVKALRRRNLLDIFAIGQILLIFCLDWRTLLYPHEMIRVPAVALMLIFFVIVSPSVKEPNEMERDG
jgi:hypothetical protein